MKTRPDITDFVQAHKFFVFPLAISGKEPLLRWRDESTNYIPKIIKWQKEYPGCNWGVDCGKSKLLVVDLDEKDGRHGLRDWEEHFSGAPATLTVATTTGGAHLYYRCDNGPNTAKSFAPGIDTRGLGGYVVAPGARIGSKYYSITQDLPIAEAPKAFKEYSRASAKTLVEYDPLAELDAPADVAVAIRYLLDEAPMAVQGDGGDITTYSVACTVRDFGISQEKALELMLDWNETKADPPWTVDTLASKVRNAYQYGKNQVGAKSVTQMFAPEVATNPDTFMHRASFIDHVAKLKKRKWLLANRFIRGFITVTVAPGGMGKSTFTILEGLAVASGMPLVATPPVKKKGNVWLINLEDPQDELDRRIFAACQFHKIHDGRDRFFSTSGQDGFDLCIVSEGRGGYTVNKAVRTAVIDTIKRYKIDLLIVDPFVRCHKVNENDNRAIDLVIQQFQIIARETDCAISLVHHTSKAGGNTAGNMDAARGASALINAARVAHTLVNMTEKAAKLYGVSDKARNWYIKLDSAKSNLGPPASDGNWYRKKSVLLWDDDEETIGVLESVKLKEVVEQTLLSLLDIIDEFTPLDTPVKLIDVARDMAGVEAMPGNAGSIKKQLIRLLKEEISHEGYRYVPMVFEGSPAVIRKMV